MSQVPRSSACMDAIATASVLSVASVAPRHLKQHEAVSGPTRLELAYPSEAALDPSASLDGASAFQTQAGWVTQRVQGFVSHEDRETSQKSVRIALSSFASAADFMLQSRQFEALLTEDGWVDRDVL
ncbi:hypothetical protein PF011_g27321 [Phytophthora fragariae]|uniref:Uncharacterized protein n=1 Tax=Phytophthora fragariae TaxID=53985 RepID=A0A6A3HHQ0_9STRA|nr:hypothetical protein PF011_g27321 [Phytophthora fragariae]